MQAGVFKSSPSALYFHIFMPGGEGHNPRKSARKHRNADLDQDIELANEDIRPSSPETLKKPRKRPQNWPFLLPAA